MSLVILSTNHTGYRQAERFAVRLLGRGWGGRSSMCKLEVIKIHLLGKTPNTQNFQWKEIWVLDLLLFLFWYFVLADELNNLRQSPNFLCALGSFLV